jgi:beta-glucosidase
MTASRTTRPTRSFSPWGAPRAALAILLASAAVSAASAEERLPYRDPALSVEGRIDDVMARLTLEEKIAFVHANGKFRSGGLERLGLPYLWATDGPHGIREELKLDSWESAGSTSDFATALPTGIALAATWSSELAEAYGRVLGEEARARDKHVVLGPALNIMRTPLCGRNYDYFGEDPWLAGRIAVGYVRGMQAEQTVASLKHFALNNQETSRSSIDVQLDERTLREIYLPAFEAAVREAGVLSVMGGYNKVRGEHACHNDYLLNQVLKREWGFAGAVISDWGGTHDTDEAVRKGLDLEMGTGKPYEQYYLAGPFLEGIRSGLYPVSLLDDKVRRNLRLLFAAGAVDGRRPGSINTREHQTVARRIAQEGTVLLKNEPAVLPLDLAGLRTIAVIGDNAVRRFAAGGGAAGVKAFHETTALEGILARVGGKADVVFSQGYRQPERRFGRRRDTAGVRTSELTASSAEEAKELADRAVEAARKADAVVFVGGLTHQWFGDDEGVDRRDLSLFAGQDALIARIAKANPRTIVVLVAGSPIEMSAWLADVPAVLQAWYGGSEAGHALASLLFGDASPSGKLPCTFPKRLSESPAHASGEARQFPGESGKVYYDEGLLVGYRWNDTKKIEPLFPFGHGLSYTSFRYQGLRHTLTSGAGGPSLSLQLGVTNTGAREGAETVQVYVRPLRPKVVRPEKELKGFAKVMLKPGESKTVTIELGPRSFAYYDPEAKGWRVAAGRYELLVGASSRDIRLTDAVSLAKGVLVH